ncbi:MAG: TetR/AcrR family transcriptional regulator [Acidobacteria bacterium]|nr:TetR/AcrR family transcriptional regulator [Acidobacteriota bacterium]MBV9144689.1 TetR/AcrR family transcriptional regulator [Acidobacteriota bacterium]MBV9435369.1 TetR/AcrR family transcriptional regulator [Acidobacteriota bacterium]
MPRLSSADRKLQVLDVAAELFARHGFDGVTTRQIADAAGITEAIVFRHFATKDDLYWEVLSAKSAPDEVKKRLEERLRSDAEPFEIFTEIARHVLDRNLSDPAKSRLLLFSGLENHRLSQRFFKTYMSEWYELLAGYIRKQIAAGKFREVDPVLAARGFIGMVFHHYLVQEVFGGAHYQSYDLDDVARTMAGLWLSGIAAETLEAVGVAGTGSTSNVRR